MFSGRAYMIRTTFVTVECNIFLENMVWTLVYCFILLFFHNFFFLF